LFWKRLSYEGRFFFWIFGWLDDWTFGFFCHKLHKLAQIDWWIGFFATDLTDLTDLMDFKMGRFGFFCHKLHKLAQIDWWIGFFATDLTDLTDLTDFKMGRFGFFCYELQKFIGAVLFFLLFFENRVKTPCFDIIL